MGATVRGVIATLLLLALAACGKGSGSALEIAFIGGKDDAKVSGARLSPVGQHLRSATAAGLVGLDAEGQVVPQLADRWIVTDGGTSYIFRLRDLAWPDGRELTAEEVRDALVRVRRQLRGTTLGSDLAQIADVRAMTGKVVEIRLANPMPDFLQLLAQPELGLVRDDRGLGPMALERDEGALVLKMLSPAARGLPQVEDWEATVRPLRLRVAPAKAAIEMFDDGKVDVVLGGRLESLPLVETGPLSRGTVRIDPALGLFGLRVVRPEGFLNRPENREALALAIDRDTLLEPFNVGGWVATTRIVPPGLPGERAPPPERWSDSTFAQRQSEAARRVSAWKNASGGELVLRIAIPEGPGGDLLFGRLGRNLTAVGITVVKVAPDEKADLRLIDTLARYGEPQWFLNQFHCGFRGGLCSSAVDRLVAQAQASRDPAEASRLLAQAEAQLTSLEAFIPFGAPIRWSLVRSDVTGFSGNRWGFHPLPPLAEVSR
ncbi:MAG TPA: ABC transporter substrate-binding protein [Croceibacterium sp.]|nr:ABC transporter substrate-binding protein [Croceibacterium sp.]